MPPPLILLRYGVVERHHEKILTLPWKAYATLPFCYAIIIFIIIEVFVVADTPLSPREHIKSCWAARRAAHHGARMADISRYVVVAFVLPLFYAAAWRFGQAALRRRRHAELALPFIFITPRHAD